MMKNKKIRQIYINLVNILIILDISIIFASSSYFNLTSIIEVPNSTSGIEKILATGKKPTIEQFCNEVPIFGHFLSEKAQLSLCKDSNQIKTLVGLSKEELLNRLLQIDGIGPKIAAKIIDYFIFKTEPDAK